MRAEGRDIVEQFGLAPDDDSELSLKLLESKNCPFRHGRCSKFNHNKSAIYGVCSVTNGTNKTVGSEVIICPKRLYADSFVTLRDAVKVAWPDKELNFIADGDISNLLSRAKNLADPVIAFGQGSGNELSTSSPNGKLSMDWVIQRYSSEKDLLNPLDFIGIEIQSIDITNNYRDPLLAYEKLKSGEFISEIPNSPHGLNWANVHKRLIPQIIRKGNIYREMDRCIGFFFILPEVVFSKFEEVLGNLKAVDKASNSNLSILTYKLGDNVSFGHHRKLINERLVHYKLDDIISAFSSNSGTEAAELLDQRLNNLR